MHRRKLLRRSPFCVSFLELKLILVTELVPSQLRESP